MRQAPEDDNHQIQSAATAQTGRNVTYEEGIDGIALRLLRGTILSTNLQIRSLEIDNLETVAEIALETYHLERQYCKALPDRLDIKYLRQQLRLIIENGVGKMAIEAEKPIGFLAVGKVFL